MNIFFSVVAILAFSILLRQFLRSRVHRSSSLVLIMKKHVSGITLLLVLGIFSIPIILWILFGSAIELNEITSKFLVSLIFSLIAAVLLEIVEYSPLGKPSKSNERPEISIVPIIDLENKVPLSPEVLIELDTVERNFGLAPATKISFEAINRFGTQIEFALLDREINSKEFDPAR